MLPKTVPTEDSSRPGSARGIKVINDYGIGIDCHSRFIQVCVLVQAGPEVLQFQQTFSTSWEDLLSSAQWARNTLLGARKNFDKILKRQPLAVNKLRFNIESTYFSPRLSNERKELASMIKKNEEVLVMFAGVAPFSIVLAKNSKAKKVYSNEINRKANKYAQQNVLLNKLDNKVVLIPGGIKRVSRTLNRKFDVIVMPRPQLRDSFLEEAFRLSKKGTRIYYYDFCLVEEREKIIEKVEFEAQQYKKKIKILSVKDAGEIAPYKVRLRVDFKVL